MHVSYRQKHNIIYPFQTKFYLNKMPLFVYLTVFIGQQCTSNSFMCRFTRKFYVINFMGLFQRFPMAAKRLKTKGQGHFIHVYSFKKLLLVYSVYYSHFHLFLFGCAIVNKVFVSQSPKPIISLFKNYMTMSILDIFHRHSKLLFYQVVFDKWYGTASAILLS